MKRILITALCLITSSSFAGEWESTTQDVKDGVWSQWGHSSFENYMDEVKSECNAAMIIQPYAVKIRFPDGKEQLFLCEEIRKKHPL